MTENVGVLVVESRFDGKSVYLYVVCPDSVLASPAQMDACAERAAQAYCDRWQIETSFFVMKQEFALEKARVRTFMRLENIFSLCVLAYVYATQLLRKTKGFRKILKLLSDNLEAVSAKTHALLAGIRALAKEPRLRFISGRPRKRPKEDNRQMTRAVEEETAFNSRMAQLRKELTFGERVAGHEKLYERFFTVTETPKRGIKVQCNDAAMKESKSRFGYFSLLSNEVKDPIEALQIYRNKDVVEKAFSDIKGRLNCRRTLVSSERSLDGKLFVEFIALIILSYVKKHMQDAKLFHKYTMQGLLDELDVIESLEVPGKDPIFGEIIERQAKLYEAMGVTPPKTASLCVSGI